MIVNTQSKTETFTDKLVVVAFLNRIKARDLWDLAWLNQTSPIKATLHLMAKIWEHNKTEEDFLSQFGRRVKKIWTDPEACKIFLEEIFRFLPSLFFNSIASQEEFWMMVGNLLADQELACQTNLAPKEHRDAWEIFHLCLSQRHPKRLMCRYLWSRTQFGGQGLGIFL